MNVQTLKKYGCAVEKQCFSKVLFELNVVKNNSSDYKKWKTFVGFLKCYYIYFQKNLIGLKNENIISKEIQLNHAFLLHGYIYFFVNCDNVDCVLVY